MINFDSMNETDVREVIVRPLLNRLGYEYGTKAHIRTEVHLTYDRAFLGRKNKAKDPRLMGRADYICDAVSFGRWIVEVKSPQNPLTHDDVEQAHTYAAHPQVAAIYFLLTNGKEFSLYITGQLEAPLLSWRYAETESKFLNLLNILGYDAICRTKSRLLHDTQKPLGKGLKSNHKIIGGEVVYGPHVSNHPLFKTDVMNGMVGGITGVAVDRDKDGRLCAEVSVRSPYQQLSSLNALAGIKNFKFFCADEFISDDPDAPSIFQNTISAKLEPGIKASLFPGMEIPLPFGFDVKAYTEATGFVQENEFRGVAAFDFDYTIIKGEPTGDPRLDLLGSQIGNKLHIDGSAEFRILIDN